MDKQLILLVLLVPVVMCHQLETSSTSTSTATTSVPASTKGTIMQRMKGNVPEVMFFAGMLLYLLTNLVGEILTTPNIEKWRKVAAVFPNYQLWKASLSESDRLIVCDEFPSPASRHGVTLTLHSVDHSQRSDSDIEGCYQAMLGAVAQTSKQSLMSMVQVKLVPFMRSLFRVIAALGLVMHAIRSMDDSSITLDTSNLSSTFFGSVVASTDFGGQSTSSQVTVTTAKVSVTGTPMYLLFDALVRNIAPIRYGLAAGLQVPESSIWLFLTSPTMVLLSETSLPTSVDLYMVVRDDISAMQDFSTVRQFVRDYMAADPMTSLVTISSVDITSFAAQTIALPIDYRALGIGASMCPPLYSNPSTLPVFAHTSRDLLCAAGFGFNAICEITCEEGYHLTDRWGRYAVCGSDGSGGAKWLPDDLAYQEMCVADPVHRAALGHLKYHFSSNLPPVPYFSATMIPAKPNYIAPWEYSSSCTAFACDNVFPAPGAANETVTLSVWKNLAVPTGGWDVDLRIISNSGAQCARDCLDLQQAKSTTKIFWETLPRITKKVLSWGVSSPALRISNIPFSMGWIPSSASTVTIPTQVSVALVAVVGGPSTFISSFQNLVNITELLRLKSAVLQFTSLVSEDYLSAHPLVVLAIQVSCSTSVDAIIRINGIQMLSYSTTTDIANTCARIVPQVPKAISNCYRQTQLLIGGNGVAGRVAELAIYNELLSLREVEAIEIFLGAKWGEMMAIAPAMPPAPTIKMDETPSSGPLSISFPPMGTNFYSSTSFSSRVCACVKQTPDCTNVDNPNVVCKDIEFGGRSASLALPPGTVASQLEVLLQAQVGNLGSGTVWAGTNRPPYPDCIESRPHACYVDGPRASVG